MLLSVDYMLKILQKLPSFTWKKFQKLKIPNTGLTNIRLDIGVDEGDEISFYYDPMIAKIISKGSNRNESIKNMIKYLKEFEIEGINTNKSFLISVLQK